MLSLRDITKNYYLNKTNVVKVLKGVTIDFRKNEFVSILGASGCGKTTLLNVIGGLDTYEGGDLIVDGVSTKNYTASDWDNYRNKKIGFVFQSYNLIQHLNVVRNVEMPLILAGEKKTVARQRAIELLKTVGLEEQIYKKPLQLSGGQMQRVAIARALVSDPEIILADEPTGALDNEASVQVMALLKEIAKDHLVVMVTHNDILAKEYSTRIINLSGGVVCGDTDPYEAEETPVVAKTTVEEPRADAATTERKKKGLLKKEARNKSHLSFKTAIELSARNLVSKKVRTALTSFAGSIGIIGIVLVLAFSSGVKAYIANMERSALSLSPITISEQGSDATRYLSIMQKMMNSMANDERESYPDTEEIYTNRVMANAMTELSTLIDSTNDLVSFKKYLDENFNDQWGYIKYDYGVDPNVYCPDPDLTVAEYMKVNPFVELMQEKMSEMKIGGDAFSNSMAAMAKDYVHSWAELSDDQTVLEAQYELVGKNSRWPSQELTDGVSDDGRPVKVAEVIIAVDERNQLSDYSLFMLGLRSGTTSEILKALNEFEDATYTVDDLLNLRYRVLGNSDYVIPAVDEETGEDIENNWTRVKSTEQSRDFIESNYSVLAKVVGVVRPKQGSSYMSISGAVGYNSSLKSYLIERANNHPATQYMQETVRESDNSHANPFIKGAWLGDADYASELVKMGVADLSKPSAILIYANSFDAKQKIAAFIEEYNNSVDSDKMIKYSDMLSTITSYVNTISTAVSSALIGFMSVSLIVSSIMIAVIIYTSVLERRKEVGILRSVGARKKDIVSIFMAESGILGLSSGLLGVFLGWIITLPLKEILLNATGIPNLAVVEWWHVVMMVLISLTLSIAAGVVPAFLGAKQDPAVALRTD